MSEMKNDPEIKVIILSPTSTQRDIERKERILERRNRRRTRRNAIDSPFRFLFQDDIKEIVILFSSEIYEEDLSPNSFQPERKLNLPELTTNANQEECVICKRNYEDGEKICISSCLHKFHSNCLSEWIKHNPSCPICRTTVPTTT